MKNLARCFVLLFFITFVNNCYGQEWVAYQSQPIQQPVIQYTTPHPQPVVVYQWIPVIVQQNVVIERYCLFHRTQTLTTVPVIRYVYQPVIIYR